tara:strand:+ start:716 stop:1057 length:342 start_codon:yes stop_codon:yes gene_type:complete
MKTVTNMKNVTIKKLNERMKRAKKRALRRARRYNVGKKPPFERGVIDGESVSPYRLLSQYADRIIPRWDGDPDDKPSICEIEDMKKLAKDLYIYCSSAARIVTKTFRYSANKI